MKYTPSVNIEYGIDKDFKYIVTPNAQQVIGNIISSFRAGMHTFSLIGTYGTGKSSFLMALERDLNEGTTELVSDKSVFGKFDGFECLNILGDYNSLSNLLADKLNCGYSLDTKNIFNALSNRYQNCKKQNKLLLIVIDEFGKVLEHASKNSPEKELYFLQRLAEFVNTSTRQIILLTTLHQNFGAYATGLSETQRNEWTKVKGRFKEIVFSEPVEQLLYLASEQLSGRFRLSDNKKAVQKRILSAAIASNFVNKSLTEDVIDKLSPLDTLSAMCITKAIQKYGQNERTLFSFLTAEGSNSINDFIETDNCTYNLSIAYDYLIYNFFSALSEINSDTAAWTSMRVAIERVGGGELKDEYIEDAIKIVKAIGMLNLFGTASTSLSKSLLMDYARFAMNIENPEAVLKQLEIHKIVRYASYKSSYILFDGTDIDLEDELYKAASIVPYPQATVDDLAPYIQQRALAVSEAYYQYGTPRYFEFIAKNEPEIMYPANDIDGYVQMIFPLEDGCFERTLAISRECKVANLYAVFLNVDEITRHLYEIQKLTFIQINVIIDDRVARREVQNHIKYEQGLLNAAINDIMTTSNDKVVWIYNGEVIKVKSYRELNKTLTKICREVYSSTPIIKNELFNKQKLSSSISLARIKLLDAMIENHDKEDFGFPEDSFPPEKTIYYTLFRKTGIHRINEEGQYVLDTPIGEELIDLWNECESFVASTIEKPRKIIELIKILKTQPFKLKQGFLEFWIPVYLFIRQQNFAIYNSNGAFVMSINKEFFELLQKNPGDFSIKAFNVNGIKTEFFKKYQQFLNKNSDTKLSTSSFIATFKPFLVFYKNLNDYAKSTNKFEHKSTVMFRNVLATAKDPEKAFFEDIPQAFGYRDSELNGNNDVLDNYITLIKGAVRELNTCYDMLIDRIERHIIEQVSLPETYEEYKPAIEERYAGVKKHLLTTKCRTFLERLLAPSTTKREFIEKISNVVIDKRLVQIKDKEEEYLLDNIVFLFHELDQFVSISALDNGKDEVYNIDLASNQNVASHFKTYILPDSKKSKADQIIEKITKNLSGDADLDICVLLKLLNKRLS